MGTLSTFNHFVILQRGNNLRRDKLKDDSPFRNTLAGCKITLSVGVKFRGQRH